MRAPWFGLWLLAVCGCAAATTYDFFVVVPPASAVTPTGIHMTASGLNNGGVVVGGFQDANVQGHGFVRKPDGTVTVVDAPGASSTGLDGINTGGWIVGVSNASPSGYGSQGFLLSPDGKTFTPLATPPATAGGSYYPSAINDLGDVVGTFYGSDGQHGWLLTAAGVFSMIDYPGAVRTIVGSINNSGQITGSYLGPDQWYHGFLRSAEGASYTPIDFSGINNLGQGLVSSGIQNPDGSVTPVVLPGTPGQSLSALNDVGEVAGTFEVGKGGSVQSTYAYLATPMTPSTTPMIRSYYGLVTANAFGGAVTIAPGSWVEVYGAGFTDHARQWQASDFAGGLAPQSLDGVSVIVSGEPAYVSYISPEQINALVPFSATPGQVSVTVSNGGLSSAPQPVTISALQPGLLVEPAQYGPYVVAMFGDGVTYALPPGNLPGVPCRRPVPGDTIVLYGTGFGPVNPAPPDGQVTAQLNNLQSALVVGFGSVTQAEKPATVSFAGLAPGYLGLYQFNVVVPAVQPDDAMMLYITLNGVPMQQSLQIAVGQ